MTRSETDSKLIESLIESARAMAVVPAVSDVKVDSPAVIDVPKTVWEESSAYTQFLLRWMARPPVSSLTKVFTDELIRRRGLRAYGIRLPERRRSKILSGQSVDSPLASISALVPRQLSVAKPSAA